MVSCSQRNLIVTVRDVRSVECQVITAKTVADANAQWGECGVRHMPTPIYIIAVEDVACMGGQGCVQGRNFGTPIMHSTKRISMFATLSGRNLALRTRPFLFIPK